MARPSPGAQRVVALLNFFASHPGQAYSLTDLVRSLKINRATCHSLLAELVDAAYLYRTNDKRYVLGPAVARLGRAAALPLSPLQVALPEMRTLADQYDVVCMAVFHVDGEAVVREHAASVSHLFHPILAPGARWPLRPPFGGIFLAGASHADADAWLDALAPPPSDAERERTKQGIAFVAEHGFQFVFSAGSGRGPEETGGWLFLPDPSQRPYQVAAALDAELTYPMTGLSAPVFDKRGRVAFVLSLAGFAGLRTGADIAAIGATVRAACQRITDFVEASGDGAA
jgi:DNA-binding IclR family transcriptional regulator